MRINLLLTVIVILFALAFIFVSDQAEALDIKKITQGIVKEVKNNFVKIQENIDLNNNGFLVATDTNTVFDNVQELTDLKAGDKVQIEYKTDQDRNIAITITKLEIEG